MWQESYVWMLIYNCEKAFESLERKYVGDVNHIVAEQMVYVLECDG